MQQIINDFSKIFFLTLYKMSQPTELTAAAFQRMALKAGLIRTSESSLQYMRKLVIAYLHDVLKNAVIYAEHARRRTIDVEDVLQAVERQGLTKMYEEEETGLKACKISYKKTIEARIRDYQKQSECYYIPHATFQRLAREIAAEFRDDLRFTAAGILNLQLATEMYIIKMYQIGLQAMIHAGRITLQDKDLIFAHKIEKTLHTTY